MGPVQFTAESCEGPVVFGLDAALCIVDVKTVPAVMPDSLCASLLGRHFLSLVPAEVRRAADDFIARLCLEQMCSTNQLFLQYPGSKAVPVDLFCRRVAKRGKRVWEAVAWSRARSKCTERELMLLYAVSSRLSQSTSEFAFAEDVLFQLHNMMDVDASGLMFLQRGRLKLKASRGFSPASLAMLAGLPSWRVDLYLPIDSSDSPALMPQGTMEQAALICRLSGCNSWLVVPVRTPIQFYGVLGVARQTQEPFTERERYLLMSLARNLANASEKGRLFRRLTERNRKLARSRRELRASLDRLERAHRELQHLDELKKSFITLTSHELQTPLTTIIGNAELLYKSSRELPPRAREHLDEMLGGVDDLRGRIEALLAANRVGSGLFVPRFNRCTVEQIFAELEPEFAALAAGRSFRLRCSDAVGQDILVDRELVKQALRLQLENAIRHTPPGGEICLGSITKKTVQMLQRIEQLRQFYPDIEQRLERFSDYLLVTVEDSGEGIVDSEKTKIFSPFYTGELQRHHSSRSFASGGKGFGIGLSLARRIIEAHNGLIWVENREGGGSRFCQLLPLTA